MTANLSFSNAGRAALRAAIVAHPDWSALSASLGIANLSGATKATLLDVAARLSIDATPFAAIRNADASANGDNGNDANDADANDADANDADNADADAPSAFRHAVEADAARDVAAIMEPLKPFAGSPLFNAMADSVRTIIRERDDALASAATVPVAGAVPAGGSAIVAAQFAGTEKLGKLFGMRGKAASLTLPVYRTPHAEMIDPLFVWDNDVLASVAVSVRNGKHVLLIGPRGTGKTSFAKQFAARCGRPFVRILFDANSEGKEHVGQLTLEADGNGATVSKWQDGALLRAIRTPGCVILLDEVNMARPGCVSILQGMLDDDARVTVTETGETVHVAKGVTFFGAINGNGFEDASGLYAGTEQMNGALLSRFGIILEMRGLTVAQTAELIRHHAGVSADVADAIASFADATRAAGTDGTICEGVQPRQMVNFAIHATAGYCSVSRAFEIAIEPYYPTTDRPHLRQMFSAFVSNHAFESMVKGKSATPSNVPPAATPQGRDAQADFANA